MATSKLQQQQQQQFRRQRQRQADARDNKNYPNLFEETRDMLLVATLVYAQAKLRYLARKGKLSANDAARILQSPLSASDIMQVLTSNQDLIHQEIPKMDAHLAALETIQERAVVPEEDPLRDPSGDGGVSSSGSLVVFDDENSTTELVYGITVNPTHERIVVGFRGSVTFRDFLMDANTRLRKIANPVVDMEPKYRQTAAVGVHTGFFNYLTRVPRGKERSKLDTILMHLRDLLKEHPRYRVYFSGHSLGGALATLMAFVAAGSSAASRLPTVTCITFGAPKIGNRAFQRAFRELEREGRIRCLRVANVGDTVTRMPDFATCGLRSPDITGITCIVMWAYIVLCQSRLYRHVGKYLKLRGGGRYRIGRPRECWICNCYFSVCCRDVVRKTGHALYVWLTFPFALLCSCWCAVPGDPWNCDLLHHHSPVEYLERLESVREELEGMWLDLV